MQIGPYEILGELGRGGMGVVYRARSSSGSVVAIKVLAKRDRESIARFERERRIVASFSGSDGFVPLLDAGVAPQGLFLVMPLVPGGTLRDRFVRGPLSIEEALVLGRALARALGRAHERGIVHRDLKPENVLFSADGTPLVADLGLAKHFSPSAPGASQSSSLSRSGAFRGTAGYMAPEQMTDAKGVGPQADVFALGAIVYEGLAGRPAFAGEGVLDVLTRVTAARFEPLRRVRPDVPGWLAAAVERALAADPAARPGDGFAFGRSLEPPVRARGRAVALLGGLGLAGSVALFAVLRPSSSPRAALQPGHVAPSNPHGAITTFDRTIEREPKDALAWSNRGAAKLDAGDDDDPKDTFAWLNRATAKQNRGDHDGAIADLDRAIALDTKNAIAWSRRGVAKLNQGDFAGAHADLNAAITLDPRDASSWSNRGSARLAEGDLDGAIADLDRALTLSPKNALAWSSRAVAKSRKGNHEGAIADLDQAIALDPEDATSWGSRGVAKLDRGDTDGAIADLDRAIALSTRLADAWRVTGWFANRGVAKLNRGNTDGAIADLDKAIERDARIAVPWANRGLAKLNRRDYEGAIADLDRAIELDPESTAAWTNRGIAKLNLGDKTGAIADYQKVVALAPNDPATPEIRKAIAHLRAQR